MDFAHATAVDFTGHGHAHTAEVQPGWDIMGNANGGYLLAIGARALSLEADGREPVSITAHYLAPGRPGPLNLDTETVRQGRSYTTARGTLVQNGRPMLSCLGTFSSAPADADPVLLCDGSPPKLPAPTDCVPVEPGDPFPPPFMGKVDMRLHPDDAGFMSNRRSGVARIRGYLKIRGEERVDSFGLMVMADAFPPTIFNTDLPVAWVPTLELTVHVRARPVPGWLRSEVRTRFVSGGRLEVDGETWDESGQLVMQSRQLALVPAG